LTGAGAAASIVAAAVAVAVALAVSTRIAGPVTSLASAARRIAAGQYAERAPAGGEGEIGDLAASFDAMPAPSTRPSGGGSVSSGTWPTSCGRR